MNYNLIKGVDAGFIKFYNVGNEYVDKLLKNEYLSLDSIFESIKEKVEEIQHKYNMVNVIIDGISHLLNMQYNVRDVNTICSNIIDLVRCYKNSLLFLHCNVANELDVTHVVSNLLCHKAHMVLEVENLTSGWSADVSGHLTLKYPGRKFEDEYMFSMDLKPTRYLFKLFDRGVKLLAPGTV
ncbi:unnamed protein product [Parnassius apollo]|uniref:(apollo) hypothetical protein n=1 Tax=Parnassius apollo TaxID=110799 RepID=A0A8S3YBC2_PARAO|nr:unnamed protein product [Parnassius apollo]